MGAVLVGPWGANAKLTSAQRQLFARAAWDAAGVEPFCDPRDMVRGLGLRPVPDNEVDDVRIEPPRVFYPSRASIGERGELLYDALARHLLCGARVPGIVPEHAARGLAGEFILPTYVAVSVSLAEAISLQWFVRPEKVTCVWRWHDDRRRLGRQA